MKGYFEYIVQNGRLRAKNPKDYEKFLQEKEGKELIGTLEDKELIGERKKMLNFFHGPVLDQCVRAWHELGDPGVDKVVAKYRLKAYFLKDYFINKDKEEEHFVRSLGRTTKEELKRFLDQVLYFMQTDLETSVPDPQQYKLNLKRSYARNTHQ